MTGALIVGGGQAGVQAAITLRELHYDAPIMIVGSEPHPPYQRPPLSKSFLMGTSAADSLYFRKPAVYERLKIDVVTYKRVVDVCMSRRIDDASGTACLDDGAVIGFDRLMIAVGGRPRPLNVPGAGLQGVRYLRTISDAAFLKDALSEAENVVIVGGGFIGLEAAAVARQMGQRVTVLEMTDRLLARTVAPELSDFLKDAHERRGVRIELDRAVTEICGQRGHVTAVRSGDELIPADAVIVGVGMTPRTELAERLRLRTAGGIVVDSYARTSDPRIVAAGDCTVSPNPMTGVGVVRLESVQNAVDQAKIAASTMAGAPVPHTAVPWFWSDQANLKLQMAGLVEGYDEVVVRGDVRLEKFSVFYFQAGQLLAVHAINRPHDFMTARKALSQRANIDSASIADEASSLVIVP